MHELVMRNFENLGLIQPENLGNSGTIPMNLGEGIVETDVIHSSHFPERGDLYLPADLRTRKLVMETVFSSMGD